MKRPDRVTLGHLVLAAVVALAPSLAVGQIPTSEYAQRRAALAARIDTGVVVAFGGREPVRHWPPFYQLPSFRYLTGFLESDAAFVMVKRGARVTSTLFLARPNARVALYYGERATPAEAASQLGLAARFAEEMPQYVDSLVASGLPVFSIGDFQSGEYSASDTLTPGRLFARALVARHPMTPIVEINRWVDELRGRKSDPELAIIRQAAEVSSRAHEEAMRAIRPGIRENEIQAIMEAEYRKRGADSPGYTSIVGAGPNSTVLHYPAGTREARAGEVVLMDVAAYYNGYSADLTRTVPVDLTFSPVQRAVYSIVLAAQKAAERQVRQGTPRNVPTDSAYAVLRSGLVGLGLIESATATFDPPPDLCPGAWANRDGTCPQWYLYVYHGFMHGIGLDVHDPAQYSNVAPNQFQPGDAFTIEPGIYVREKVFDALPDTPRNRALVAHARTAAVKYRNVGVRIEDDYVLTSKGLERITNAPREIAEIEALRKKSVVQ